MPPQQLLLSWKDHNGALVSVFENLLKRNTLVDCTLAADGQYLKAHKMVLSACSSYFELLFAQESEKNPIVILKDVKFQDLEAAVHFMYRGEVEVCEDRLAAFLEVADSLQIKGLGSDGKTQNFREKSPSLKGSKTAVPPEAHSRKEVTLTQSENIGESSITLDSDRNSHESSSHHHLPHRETSGSSPISSTLAVGSSYSIASASTSCPVRVDIDSDGVKVENSQCSSPSVSTFPLEDVPSDVNTVIKTEPVTHSYLYENSDETERDFNDVAMMEDQEEWNDPNIASMGDDHASNQHDPGFSVTHVKTEAYTSEHTADAALIEQNMSSEDPQWVEDSGGSGDRGAPQFSSVEGHQHSLDPSAILTPGSGPGPGPGLTSSVTSVRQGGVRGGCGRRGTRKAATRGVRFQCDLCEFGTSDSCSWTRHKLVHKGEKPFKCTFCTYASTNSGHLNEHMRRHTGDKPYKCTVCPFATKKSYNLKMHMCQHTGEKPYKCTICSFATSRAYILNVHLRRHTGGVRGGCGRRGMGKTATRGVRFQCDLCEYSTSDSSSWTRHKRVHTGEKPFKCTFCNYASTHSGHLNEHMRLHTGEKPYKCTICSFAASRSQHLNQHMRRHTGEKPYKCTVCPFAARHSGNLKVHMRKHAEGKP